MEVVDTNSSFSWTQQAKELIDQLVDLHEAQRKDKYAIFNRFYELWENNGLVLTVEKAKGHFTSHRNYIKNSIFSSLSKADQDRMNEAEAILTSIKRGEPYETPEGKVFTASEKEIQRFKNAVHSNKVKINNRFNRLVDEFEDFIRDKNRNKKTTSENTVTFYYDPLPQTTETNSNLKSRDSLPRDSKAGLCNGYFTGQAVGDKAQKRVRNFEVKTCYTMLLLI